MSPRMKLSTRYGINTAILVALAVGIVVIIETLSYRHNWRKDFTENKRHSLSEQTIKVLGDLDQKVKITVFAGKGSAAFEEGKALFDLYKYKSKLLDIDFIDPDLNPSLANEYNVRQYGIPVAFFEQGPRKETTTTLTEEAVTNALIKVTRGEKKVVYFLEGHGEHSLDDTGDSGLSTVKSLLANKNYEAETLILMRAEKVPDDCRVLVDCGPQKDITQPEIDEIGKYIKAGGNALFLVDPETAPSLTPFLKQYGIVLGNDVVVDRMSRLFGGDYLTPVLTTYSPQHPITRSFNIASFFAVARSVTTTEAPGAHATWLAKTGEGSWAETNIDELRQGTASFDASSDTPGPISLAAVSEIDIPPSEGEKDAEPKKAEVVVFGDSDFVTNSRVNLSGNGDLFMNTVNWLAGEESLIAIPPKESKFSPVVLTASQARMLFILPVIVLPGLALLGGIYVFVRRSRHP